MSILACLSRSTAKCAWCSSSAFRNPHASSHASTPGAPNAPSNIATCDGTEDSRDDSPLPPPPEPSSGSGPAPNASLRNPPGSAANRSASSEAPSSPPPPRRVRTHLRRLAGEEPHPQPRSVHVGVPGRLVARRRHQHAPRVHLPARRRRRDGAHQNHRPALVYAAQVRRRRRLRGQNRNDPTGERQPQEERRGGVFSSGGSRLCLFPRVEKERRRAPPRRVVRGSYGLAAPPGPRPRRRASEAARA